MKKKKKVCYSDEICGRESIDYREKPAIVKYEKEENVSPVLPCKSRRTCVFIQKSDGIFMQ